MHSKTADPLEGLPFVTNWLLVNYFYYQASVLRALQQCCLTLPVLVNLKRFYYYLLLLLLYLLLLLFIVFIILIHIALAVPSVKTL